MKRESLLIKLWIRDSRSIRAAQGRVKRKLGNQILQTDVATLAQVHGGKKFKPRGKGARQTSLVVMLILGSYIKTMQKLNSFHKQPIVGEVFWKRSF